VFYKVEKCIKLLLLTKILSLLFSFLYCCESCD